MTTIAVARVGRAITLWEAIHKMSHELIYKPNLQKINKKVKSDSFCYHKVGRAITILTAIDKWAF